MAAGGVHDGPTTGAAAVGPEPQRQPGRVASVAVWAFTFLVLRLFAVSGYDWDTAFSVSTTLGIDDGVTLVFGSFMAEHVVVGVVLIGLLPLLIATYMWSGEPHRTSVALPTVLGFVATAAITFSFGAWWLPLGAVVVLGLFALARRLDDEHPVARAIAVTTKHVGLIGGVAVLVVAVSVQTPWVPEERIVTTDGVVFGYVLSVDPGYLNVLTENHEFRILLSRDVLSRD